MITSSIYNSNATMRIIGMQNTENTQIASKDIQNVLNAYKGNKESFGSMALDLFHLGMIYGKKAERAKRQHKELVALAEQ